MAYLQPSTRSVQASWIVANADDDEEDLDVLDPAQLAVAYANQQLAEQTQGQQHQEQQQLPTSVEPSPDCSTQQAPGSLQSDSIDAILYPSILDSCCSHQQSSEGDQLTAQLQPGDESPGGTKGMHAAQQCPEQKSQQEEELIRMDDPIFSTLSERRQKLMALEEILLNTGIEG